MTETPTQAAAAPDGADPSMEEILSSIRRILNEDDAPAPSHPAEQPGHDVANDVLILETSMLVPITEPYAGAAVGEPLAVAPRAEASHQPIAAAASTAPAGPVEQPAGTDDLVAPQAAAAAALSIGSLVRTLAVSRQTQVYSGGPTLEDIVRAELRPLLKEWLDVNLPATVERLVRAEIEKVVGQAAS